MPVSWYPSTLLHGSLQLPDSTATEHQRTDGANACLCAMFVSSATAADMFCPAQHCLILVLLPDAARAEAVRRDLKLLSNRTAVISSSELCVACGRAILDPPPNPLRLPNGGAVPPFYLFPTGQAFHVLCAAAEVVQYGGELRATRVRKLLQRLSRAEPGMVKAPGGNGSGEEAVGVLAARLEEEVGCEDPWNGELLAGMIDLPFVQPDRDVDEIMSWRI